MEGMYTDIEARSYRELRDALAASGGNPVPLANTGGLPLVADLKRRGYDLQITGFGHEHVYHGVNEYCSVSQMRCGFETFTRIIEAYATSP